MTTIRTLLVTCVVGLPAVAAAAEPASKTYVIGVAVTTYDKQKSGFEPIDQAAADMSEVVKQLAKAWKNPVVRTLSQPASTPQTEPTARNVRLLFDDLAKVVTARDRVIVFMIGHGFENKKGAVFCTSDCDFAAPRSMIRVSEIVARVRALGAKEQCVLIEACRDYRDAIAVDEVPPETDSDTRPAPVGTATVVVHACSPGEKAYLKPKTGRAHMATRLAEGLSGRADVNGDGKVTAREAVEYLRKYVTDDARALNRENQNVTVADEGAGGAMALGSWDVPAGASARKAPPLSSETEPPLDTTKLPLGTAGVPNSAREVRYGQGVVQQPAAMAPRMPAVASPGFVGGNATFPVLSSSGFNPNVYLPPQLKGVAPVFGNPIPPQYRPGNGNLVRTGLSYATGRR